MRYKVSITNVMPPQYQISSNFYVQVGMVLFPTTMIDYISNNGEHFFDRSIDSLMDRISFCEPSNSGTRSWLRLGGEFAKDEAEHPTAR